MPDPQKQPNLLIIQPDQHLGTVMGCAGHSMVQTPNLDRLAGSGIRFAQAVSNAPICTPMRGMMQTGVYWYRNGAPRNNWRLAEGLPGFAEFFAAAGYRTGYVGKWHLDGGWLEDSPGGFVPPERRKGWQQWHGYESGHCFNTIYRVLENGDREVIEGYDWEPTWHTDMTLHFIDACNQTATPWSHYTAYGPPHTPEQCPAEFRDLYPAAAIPLSPAQRETIRTAAEEEKLRGHLQTYFGQISAIDHEVGRLLEGLDRRGLAENTIVLYISDHGDILGTRSLNRKGKRVFRCKGHPTMSALRIPCLLRWPGQIPSKQVSDALVSAIDLAPTMLELAGLPVPDHMQGSSFADICRGRTEAGPEAVYLGLRLENGWRGIWDGRHLYSPEHQVLYDINKDPHELQNMFHQDKALRKDCQSRLIELARAALDEDYIQRNTGWRGAGRRLMQWLRS